MLKFILILLFTSLFSIAKANNLQINPYFIFNKDYIFTNEIMLKLKYNFNEDFSLQGYVKRSSLNGTELHDIISKKSYRPTNIQTDDENYFYEVSLTNKLFNYNNHKVLYTIGWYDNIKYNKSLQYTYADIYNYLRLGIDYVNYINDNQSINLFVKYSYSFDEVKNNINTGINTIYKINDNTKIKLQYDYYKDIKQKDTIVLGLPVFRYYEDVNNLLYTAHNISVVNSVNFNNNVLFDVLLKYSFTEDFGDNFYLGFALGF